MTIEELMTRDVVTVDPETSLREVASLLVTEHVSGVPVVAGTEVVGVISATDILEFNASAPGSPTERLVQRTGFGEGAESLREDVEQGDEPPPAYFDEFWEDAGADVVERFEQLDSPEWNVLDEPVASEVMSRALFSLPPETDVREAARRLLEAEVHRALVIEDDRLVGVVTTLDILRAVAEHGLGS